MKLGRKIYWDSITGAVIVNRSEMNGDVRESTTEEDFQTYVKLAERNPETVLGVLLDYGKYEQDFVESESYTIVESNEPVNGVTTLMGERHYDFEFVYRDPNNPEVPPVQRKPLTQEVDELNSTIGVLLMESANDKATIAFLENTVETLLFEVAALKGGAE